LLQIDEFLSKEVDEAPIVDEVQFQEIFRERLRQITAAVNVRAIQTLQTSHIDQLRDMGTSIASLEQMMQSMPQYTEHVEQVRSLADMQNTLAAKIQEIIHSTNENKQELLNAHSHDMSALKTIISELEWKVKHDDVIHKLEEHDQHLTFRFADVHSKIDEVSSRISSTRDSDFADLTSKIDSLEKMTQDVVSTSDMQKVTDCLTELRRQMDERSKCTVAEIEKHKTDIYTALQEVRNIVNDNAARQPTVIEVVKPTVHPINHPDPATLLSKKQRAILNRMYQ
jgi:myosin heavy subunit